MVANCEDGSSVSALADGTLFVPLTGRIGAEVVGIRLSGDLPFDTADAIRHGLARHKVLFFREQDHLDDEGHAAFARLLGTPFAHPTMPSVEGTDLYELDASTGARANLWHVDISFLDAYPAASVLRSVVVPSAGGDTMWANTAAAYDDLPAELKEFADRLWAVHSNSGAYASTRGEPAFRRIHFETEHPVVRVHPLTGERHLLLGAFLRNFVGFSPDRSRMLYEFLQSFVLRPENTVRWRWKRGDVAIWDNRATQHYAIDDYGNQPRVMRRMTIAGDVPLSVDGRPSRRLAPLDAG